MNNTVILFLAAGGVLTLYLWFRLWLAERDREILMTRVAYVVETDQSGAWVVLALAAIIGAGLLWLLTSR